MGSYPTEVTIEEGRRLLLGCCGALEAEETAVEDCCGRVLAGDIRARDNLPPFARSPYDGYAFRSCDTAGASKERPVTLRVIEEVPAGKAPENSVKENEAVKILTGAPVPAGADAIEMFEKTAFAEDEVTLFREYRPGTNVIPAGEDVREGDLALPAGALLSPADAGLLAGLGYARVPAVRRPRAALISTGDELLEPGECLCPGKIRNSSCYALKGYLEAAGACVHLSGIVSDDDGAIAGRIRAEAEDSDLIVTTGGVSVGDYDMVLRAYERLGAEILFWKVRMKPGMAFAAAVYEGKLLIGLSGNPASAAVSLSVLALPAVRKMAGRREEELAPEAMLVRLAKGFPKASPGRRLIPGRLVIRDGQAWLDLVPRQGNGMLHPLSGCDLLGEIPAGSPPLGEGETVRAWRL